jgi:flagellar basal body-associated protein FliL
MGDHKLNPRRTREIPGRNDRDRKSDERGFVSLLWIILIVILVLALLGFFTRGRW